MGKYKLKKYLCPVCRSYYFEDSSLEDINMGIGEPIEEDFCSVCGWKFDESQLNDFDLKTGKNPLSINEQKKIYKRKKKQNSNYNYLSENHPILDPHPCPVCGKYVFAQPLSYDFCPYCGWEDDGFEGIEAKGEISAVGYTYDDFKKKYEEIIKKDPKYIWERDCDKYFDF